MYYRRNRDNDTANVTAEGTIPSNAAQVINNTEFRKEFIYNNRKAIYLHEFSQDNRLGASDQLDILDEIEDGELIGFYFDYSAKEIATDVTLFGDNNSTYILSNSTIKDMIPLGLGMTPGDCTELPDGTYPDATGIPDPIFPFVARYKNASYDDEADSGVKHFVIRYAPVIRIPYNRIKITVRNTSNSSDRTIRKYAIDRIVYIT